MTLVVTVGGYRSHAHRRPSEQSNRLYGNSAYETVFRRKSIYEWHISHDRNAWGGGGGNLPMILQNRNENISEGKKGDK